MKRTSHRTPATACLIIALTGAALAGCSSYYRITDPSSGKQYYTKDIDSDRSGAVEFKDAQTGSRVTLQNSEVAKIKKDEYKAAVDKK